MRQQGGRDGGWGCWRRGPAAARFTALGGPEPTALTAQEASSSLPVRGGLLAAAVGLWAAVTAWWLRRRNAGPQ